MLFGVFLKKKKDVPKVRNPESVLGSDTQSVLSTTEGGTFVNQLSKSVGNNSTLLSEDQL